MRSTPPRRQHPYSIGRACSLKTKAWCYTTHPRGDWTTSVASFRRYFPQRLQPTCYKIDRRPKQGQKTSLSPSAMPAGLPANWNKKLLHNELVERPLQTTDSFISPRSGANRVGNKPRALLRDRYPTHCPTTWGTHELDRARLLGFDFRHEEHRRRCRARAHTIPPARSRSSKPETVFPTGMHIASTAYDAVATPTTDSRPAP